MSFQFYLAVYEDKNVYMKYMYMSHVFSSSQKDTVDLVMVIIMV